MPEVDEISIGTLISTFICSMLKMNKLKKARTISHMLNEEAAAKRQNYFFYQKSMLLKHDETEIQKNKQDYSLYFDDQTTFIFPLYTVPETVRPVVAKCSDQVYVMVKSEPLTEEMDEEDYDDYYE
eukprot:gene32535-40146_t